MGGDRIEYREDELRAMHTEEKCECEGMDVKKTREAVVYVY